MSATILLASCNRTDSSTAAYPPTRTVSVTEAYHGTVVADPFRWLEDLKSTEVQTWAAAQHKLAESQLRTPLRAWIYARMDTLGQVFDNIMDGDQLKSTGPRIKLDRAPSGDHKLLTIRSVGDTSPARVLVDPTKFGARKDLSRFTTSPDGKYIAYAIAEGGSDWLETRIVNVQTGRDEPEMVEGMLFEPLVWTKDSRGFFYVKNERPRADEHVMLRAPSVRYHVVGTMQAQDSVVFATPSETTDMMLRAEIPGDGRFAMIYEGKGADFEDLRWSLTRVHVLDMQDAHKPIVTGKLQSLSATPDAAYTVIGTAGSTLYMHTDNGAGRRRLVAIDLQNANHANWRTIIPERDEVLQSVQEVEGYFVAKYLKDAQGNLRVFDKSGKLLREVTLPRMTKIVAIEPIGNSELQLVTESYLRATTIWNYNITSGKLRAHFDLTLKFDTAKYDAEQVWYPSKDGTRVPMFLVHKKGLVLDGSNPTILYGYGASGSVMNPGFAEHILVWLELGGIFAEPNLRGGGEFGRAWYDAAILERKQTTFDDFIAAAEFLIKQKYTAPNKLAMHGASNGGLLVAGTVAQRPDLFVAAVADQPVTDNLRYDRGRHRAQFGSAKDSAQFQFLYAYSPMHLLRKGTCYPATLVRTSLNDDRAPAWLAMKYVATLQADQSCANPVLLIAHPGGGHYGDRGPNSYIEDSADALAFFAQRMNVQLPAAKR